MKRSVFYYLMRPRRLIFALLYKFSDKFAIKHIWEKNMNYPLNLKNPRSFNEKLQWLKLHDRNPLYHKLVDKFEVKEWVANKIGEEYIVKTYAIYNSVDEIDFDLLPNKFVLKCTHNSGSFVVCPNKEKLNKEETIRILKQGLDCVSYYRHCREWVYKGVKPRIIAEEYLEDYTYEDLVNYKFWCFNGEPRIMYITVKTNDIWENFYDMDFQPLDITHGFPKYEGSIDKPIAFEQMKEIARKLSEGIPHVRVDLYQIHGQPKFSELTFYDWGGFQTIQPIEWDYQIGSWLDINAIHNK